MVGGSWHAVNKSNDLFRSFIEPRRLHRPRLARHTSPQGDGGSSVTVSVTSLEDLPPAERRRHKSPLSDAGPPLPLPQTQLLLEWPNPEEKAYSTIHAEPGYWVPTMWVPVIVWNPQKVQDTLESWRDLLNPKYVGRVAIGDASKSAGWTQYFYVLGTRLSTKYFEDLSRIKPGFIVSSETLVEAAVSGEYPIVTTTSFSAYRAVTQKKADLRVAYPKDGIVPVVDAFFSFKNAPHPSGARLVRLFHASKEGQQYLMGESGYLSFRPDIESPNERLLPVITKLNLIPFDYRKLVQKDLDQFRKTLIGIFGL